MTGYKYLFVSTGGSKEGALIGDKFALIRATKGPSSLRPYPHPPPSHPPFWTPLDLHPP